jgi:PAS domain-containing protein
VGPEYVTVVDSDRKFVQASDNFCQLVGYRREELIGKRYDDLTAPDTNDIPNVFGMFARLGYMRGLWMLVTCKGTRILVRYECWLRPDCYIEGHMEIVGAGYESTKNQSRRTIRRWQRKGRIGAKRQGSSDYGV